jgi:hypothetical protein
MPQLTGVEMVVVGVEQDHRMFRCALKHFNENMRDGLILGSKVSVIFSTENHSLVYSPAHPLSHTQPLIQNHSLVHSSNVRLP